jgi:predicted Zn-dependent peptidase
MPINNRSLDNGIRLITEPIASTKAAAIGFWFSCGSRDERNGERGVTHFIEHMLFKGTPTRSSFDIALFFDRIGGYVNAFTEREHMCLYCVVPLRSVSASLSILADMLLHSLFDDEEIRKERDVIASEIISTYDDPEEMGMEAVLASMYGNHSVSHPIAGTINDLDNLTPEVLRDSYRRYIAMNVPVVTCAGNIDEEEIAQALSLLPYNASPGKISSESARNSDSVPEWRAERKFIRASFQQSQIFYSLPIFDSRSSSSWYVWSVIDAIVGDSVSSRLFQNLREKHGLCYALYSYSAFNRDTALWSAYLSIPPAKTDEAVNQLLAEMKKISADGLTDGEIAHAKEHISGELVLSAEDTENRMKRLARQFFYNGEIRTIDESIEIVNSLESRDIQAVVAKTFGDPRVSCIVYGKKKVRKDLLWQ